MQMISGHLRRSALALLLASSVSACAGKDSGPPVPSVLAAASATALSAVAGTSVSAKPRVRVLTSSDNPVADVPVTFALTGGGGTISGAATATDADGYATLGDWVLGTTAGANTVVATSSAISGASVTFTATASAGAPATITFSRDSLLLDQWGDTATLAVTVRDANANVIPAATLTWSTADTAVARVSAGLVSSVRAGRSLIRVVAASGSFPSIEATVPARVVLQRNVACTPPVAVGRGAATAVASYSAPELITAFNSPTWDGSRSIAWDFDNDGDDDIVRFQYSFPSSSPYSGVTQFFKNDAGTLRDSSAKYLPAGLIADHPRDFELADFDGDGVKELLLVQHGFDANPYPGAPNIFLRRSGATLENAFSARFSGASSSAFSHGSSAADIDCDGDLDIAELNLTPAYTNRLWVNTGGANFADSTTKAPLLTGSAGQRWQEVEFIDFDADGDADLFLGARSGTGWNEDLLLVNDGFGRFRRSADVTLPAPRYAAAHGINQAKAADFDGDGRQDLILFEIPAPFSSVSAIRLWRNMGNGTFSDVSAAWGLPAECTGEVVEPLYVRDMNADGWPDVIVPPGCSNLGVGILTNTGSAFSMFGFSSIASYLGSDWATPFRYDGTGRYGLFFGERGGNPVIVRRP